MTLTSQTAQEFTENQVQYFDPATFDNIPAEIYPKQKFRLLDALEYIEGTLSNDWNGHSAIAPSIQAIKMTKYFIENLPFNKNHAAFIEPDGDGGVILKWDNLQEKLLVMFDGFYVHMSYKKEGEPHIFIDDIPFFITSNTLPVQILKYIPKRTPNA